MLVAEDLHFDMARAPDQFLEHHAAVAERGFGFSHSAHKFSGQIRGPGDLADAPAPAACDSLDKERITDFFGGFRQRADVLRLAPVAGEHGHACFLCDALGFVLRAHGADGSGRRADPGESGGEDGFSEGGVFGEEAVAGVNGVRARPGSSGEDGLHAQIAFGGGGGADMDGFIRLTYVHRGAVGIGIDGDGFDSEAAAGAEDPDGDFTPVRDEEFGDFHGRPLPCPGARWRPGRN